MVPFSDYKIWITGGHTRYEAVIPGLDGLLGGIATMVVRSYMLEVYAVLGESSFDIFWAFIVQNVEFRGISVAVEFLEGCSPSVYDGASLEVS